MTKRQAETAYRKYIRGKYDLKRNAPVKVDKKMVKAIQTYHRRYREQAISVETQLRFSQMSREKKKWLQRKKELAAQGLLNKETRQVINAHIKANTLDKETRKEIRKEIETQKDLRLRDEELDATKFFVQYESTKRQLKEEGIKGDPMQYIVRQQAYKVSQAQYEALSQAYDDEVEAKEEGDYIEDSIFRPEWEEYSEVEIRTGAIELEEVIDFDIVKEKYHDLKDKYPGMSSYDLQAQIGHLYFGSK